MNRWNIPQWLEEEVKCRDTKCIYCGMSFEPQNTSRKFHPTWEHIINDASIITSENIALCCFSCNASKGAKELLDWLESGYCKSRNISRNTVAEVVKNQL